MRFSHVKSYLKEHSAVKCFGVELLTFWVNICALFPTITLLSLSDKLCWESWPFVVFSKYVSYEQFYYMFVCMERMTGESIVNNLSGYVRTDVVLTAVTSDWAVMWNPSCHVPYSQQKYRIMTSCSISTSIPFDFSRRVLWCKITLKYSAVFSAQE